MREEPNGPNKSEKMFLKFEEVHEGSSDFDTAIAIPAAPEESQESIELKLTERLKQEHWYLQDSWRSKSLCEQFVIKVGDDSVEIFNFGRMLLPDEISKITAALKDMSRLKNTNVLRSVSHIAIDNEQPLNPHTGEAMNGLGGRDGAIKLYPAALSNQSHRVPDVSNLEGTVIHEFSHSLPTDFIKSWRKSFGWQFIMENPKTLPGGAVTIEETTQPERCITEYATINAAEDICDSMVAALRNPAALDAEKFEKIKIELLPESAKDVLVEVEKKSMNDQRLPQLSGPIKYKRVAQRVFRVKPETINDETME